MHQFCKLYLSPSGAKMNKARTRIILAFIFLALVQIACGCEVDHNVAVHVYQDFNGNSTQDSDEPGFPGIEIGNDLTRGFEKTNNNGDESVGRYENIDCSNYWPPIRVPSGYTITENSRNPANWDFTPIFGTAECPSYFKFGNQDGTWTVGLQPVFTMTKTASPTTFSAAEQTISYTYVISNTTANNFTQVSVTDDKTTVTCPAATVAAGASMTCTATYVTSGEDVSRGSITNTAQFTATVALRDYLNYGYNLNLTSAPVSATVTVEEVEVTCECEGTTEVCSDGSSTENAVACTQPPVLTGPLLTGEVITLCDTVNRPINLRLVAGDDTALISSELTNGNLRVSIGGTDISNTCGVNPSNTTLLTCTYPAGISSFPSPGLLTYNGSQIDSFDFYGENDCTPPPSSNGAATTEEPPTGTSACDTEPDGFACFCETNEDPDCPAD